MMFSGKPNYTDQELLATLADGLPDQLVRLFRGQVYTNI